MVSSQPRLPKSARKAVVRPLFAETEPFARDFAMDEARSTVVSARAHLGFYLDEANDLATTGEAPRLSADTLLTHWSRVFSTDELNEIVIPQRTFARRKANGEPLTVDETERALRLARIAVEAERVFADTQKAARWLRKPNRALNAHAPLALLVTETGARAVEELLGQIDHGFFA